MNNVILTASVFYCPASQAHLKKTVTKHSLVQLFFPGSKLLGEHHYNKTKEMAGGTGRSRKYKRYTD